MNPIFFLRLLFCASALFFSTGLFGQATSETNVSKKIVFFGSSVPRGEGATDKHGYTSIFSDILKERTSPDNNQWETVNISVGGDNTIKVMQRYERDLLPLKGDYVLFALALGNEGIHEKGKPIFHQFEKNLKLLIDRARTDGYTPIITNSYTRNDYNERDYQFIKQMNLRIQTWDVPSINLLGAVDDLSGHWMDGYWADGAHPNDAGHLEMAYTIVPSLFDALESNKPLPERVGGSSLDFKNKKQRTGLLVFTPEHIVHPFTTAISFKTGALGTIIHFTIADGKETGSIEVSTKGKLLYNSPQSEDISGIKVDDNQWHTVTISHYHARGLTLVYLDGALQGSTEEKLVVSDWSLGGPMIPKRIAYKDWLFYRSAMNQDEIAHIAHGPLLKSSLELYAPLDGKKVNISKPLSNLAQSLNTIEKQ